MQRPPGSEGFRLGKLGRPCVLNRFTAFLPNPFTNLSAVLLAALAVLRFFVVQHKSGQKGIWCFPLSRFTPRESRKRSEIAERRITPVWDFLRFSR